VEYAIELVNCKQYSYAKELVDLVMETKYQAFDEDIEEIEEITLLDIQSYNLTNINIQKLCQYAIYTTYQVSNNKVEDIYYYFKNNPNFIHISIEDAFKLGIEQLEDLDNFFEKWIQYLSELNGNVEYRLLKEALDYTGYKMYEKYIRQMTQNQPLIFINIFAHLKKENKISELISLGNEVLETIGEEQEIGSNIALYLANIDTRNQEKYIYTAFMFKASILNLLRIINNGYYNKYEKDIKNKIKSNNSKDKYYLKFFIGDFEDFYEESIKHKRLLGWTGSFEKMSVYMWLLLLNQTDNPTKSYSKLLTSVFQEIDYNEDENGLFENDIRKIWITWKKQFKLETETREKAMKWLNKVIENRVDVIMEGNYRKSYYKVALIIVGYGEILENQHKGAKEEYINYYKKKYSRRSAFRYELDELI